jgi:hypothetical protein
LPVCSWPRDQIAAHHAFAAEFDADKPIKLTGAVTKVDWRNPHTWFFIDVKMTRARSRIGAWKWEARTAS